MPCRCDALTQPDIRSTISCGRCLSFGEASAKRAPSPERVRSDARRLADKGAAVIIVTHDVESVLNVSDRVVVRKLGRVLLAGDTDALGDRDLVQLMAGTSAAESGAFGSIWNRS